MRISPCLDRGAQALVATALLSSLATAQNNVPLLPFQFTNDLYVSDSGTDSVWRLQDLNQDGDYDDTNEVVLFYDEDLGTISLGNNNGVTVGVDGTVYVSDSSSDIIMGLRDLNADGDCHEAGEHWVFFDGQANGSNIPMISSANMTADFALNLWVAVANTNTGDDMILKLNDLNFDGDANDPGEAVQYYVSAVEGESTGNSIPVDVAIGSDGLVYYADTGSTGVVAKGIYRLEDLDSSGDIDPLTEVSTFFVPPVLPAPNDGNPFFWGLTRTADDTFYIADTGNDVIWKVKDENQNGFIDPGTSEEVLWWDSPDSSQIWRLDVDDQGRIVAAESQAPDRILRFDDADDSGTIDPLTEVSEVYSDTVSSTVISNPRTLVLGRQPTLQIDTTPSIGTTTKYRVQTTIGDLAFVYYSIGTIAPIPVPPYGELEVSPLAYGLWFGGVAGQLGFLDLDFPLPDDSELIGLSLSFQGLVGPLNRLFATNAVTQTYQP